VTGERTQRTVHISSYPLLHLQERLARKQLAKSGKEEREIPIFRGLEEEEAITQQAPACTYGIGIGKSLIGWGVSLYALVPLILSLPYLFCLTSVQRTYVHRLIR